MQKQKVTAKTCLTCGLCCMSPNPQNAFADVTETDVKRLDKKFRLKVLYPRPIDQLAAMFDPFRRLPYGALATKGRTETKGVFSGKSIYPCVALEGHVGVKVRCKTYKNRPDVCRTAVVPGDKTCRRLRKEYKL